MPCVLKRLASWLPSPCGSQTAVHAMERQTQILTSAHYKIFTPDQTIQFCYGSRTSLRIPVSIYSSTRCIHCSRVTGNPSVIW